MNSADIERMAREANQAFYDERGTGHLVGVEIHRFAALVRAHAMEEAAQIASRHTVVYRAICAIRAAIRASAASGSATTEPNPKDLT